MPTPVLQERLLTRVFATAITPAVTNLIHDGLKAAVPPRLVDDPKDCRHRQLVEGTRAGKDAREEDKVGKEATWDEVDVRPAQAPLVLPKNVAAVEGRDVAERF